MSRISSKSIPLSALKIPFYQRALSEPLVNKITSSWDPRRARVTVARCGKDAWRVLDGQHTVEAARRLKVRTLHCRVVSVANDREEIEIFHGINTVSKRHTLIERHRTKVLLGDPLALRIEALCRAAGVSIHENTSANQFSSVSVLNRFLKVRSARRVDGGPLVPVSKSDRDAAVIRAFDVAGRAFSGAASRSGKVIGALANFFWLFPEQKDATIVRVLKKIGYDAFRHGIGGGDSHGKGCLLIAQALKIPMNTLTYLPIAA